MTALDAQNALAARLAQAGLDWIVPDWPAPATVRALSTTRNGRCGEGFDLSRRHPDFERARRELLSWLPGEPVWLTQVHGAAICDADAANARSPADPPLADGAVAHGRDVVCAVHCADCLPVLFAERAGSVVAVAHAGWRGLAAGVLEAALAAMRVPAADVCAWLGPAIGPQAFEVGADVVTAHCANDPGAMDCFRPHRPAKWLADLYGLARRRLHNAGVASIHGGGRCTLTEAATFHSYRRDGADAAGRMETLIWIASD